MLPRISRRSEPSFNSRSYVMPTEDDLQAMLDEREALEALEDGPGKPPTLNKDGTPRKVRELFPVSPVAEPRPPRKPQPLGTVPTADELAAAALAPMTSALDRAGVTDDLIATTILAGMNSRKVVTASYEGKITDAAHYEDGKLRLEAAALASKLKGHMVDRQIRDVRNQSIIYIGGIDRTDPGIPGAPGGPALDVKEDGKV
jgi:hypothetical protein